MVSTNPRGVSVPEPACRGATEPTQEDIRQGGERDIGTKEPEALPMLSLP